MSEALERVIAEQQTELDLLRAQRERPATHATADTAAKEDLFRQAANIAEWEKLRDCWKDDMADEWREFTEMRHALRLALHEYGFCLHCQAMHCTGECRDE